MSHGIERHVRECANDGKQHKGENDIHGYKSSKASISLLNSLMDVEGDNGNADDCYERAGYQDHWALAPAGEQPAKKADISDDSNSQPELKIGDLLFRDIEL